MSRGALLAGGVGAALMVGVLALSGSFSGPFNGTTPSFLRPQTVAAVPECGGAGLPYGSFIRYGPQTWECTELGDFYGDDGAWTYPGAPIIPFSARTPPEPQGAGSTSDIHFAPQNPGGHYMSFGAVLASVEFVGTCGGGCAAGTEAVAEVVQHNEADGGHRLIAALALRCTAPRETCVAVDRVTPGGLAPELGCGADGGIYAPVLPVNQGGTVYIKYKADGGLCSTFPVVNVSGWGFQYMQKDGGGV